MSYGAEGLGSGEAAGIAPGGHAHNDERISGAFYIGRGTFRMETLEGGVVSAPLIGALTPERGIGYLPGHSEETFARAGEETLMPGWLLTEPDHQPQPAVATSRSLVSTVALLAFISGALLTALLFNLKHSPLPVAAAPPVAASPTSIQAPTTIAAPAPAAEPEAPPPPPPIPEISPASKITAPAVVARPIRRTAAIKERDREKAALARFPKVPVAPPPANWVDPFAD